MYSSRCTVAGVSLILTGPSCAVTLLFALRHLFRPQLFENPAAPARAPSLLVDFLPSGLVLPEEVDFLVAPFRSFFPSPSSSLPPTPPSSSPPPSPSSSDTACAFCCSFDTRSWSSIAAVSSPWNTVARFRTAPPPAVGELRRPLGEPADAVTPSSCSSRPSTRSSLDERVFTAETRPRNSCRASDIPPGSDEEEPPASCGGDAMAVWQFQVALLCAADGQ